LKKRTKKLWSVLAEPCRKGSAQFAKVFCFFFSKKQAFLFAQVRASA
jgi:hypothetical protein